MTSLAPYMVSVPEAALDDLRARLAQTRWIDDLPGSQWRLGVSQPYLRELCDYWRTRFDWRAQEAQLNGFDQHLIEVDGQPIHVVHAPSQRSDALPLLLIHGWPGSVFEYIKVFRPLADPVPHGGSARDSFHVVAPSIPGYGFSGPTTESGWGPTRIASAFATLMDMLGYERYGLAGGDWGAIISTELARLDGGRHVCAVHLTMPLGKPPPDGQSDPLSADEQRGLDDWAEHQAAGTVVHVRGEQHAPTHVGLRAERLAGWTCGVAGGQVSLVQRLQRGRRDCVHPGRVAHRDLDVLVDWDDRISVAPLLRACSRDEQEPRRRDAHRRACWLRDLPPDVRRVPRSWAERVYSNIERWSVMPSGGHFPGLEKPGLLTAELREFFRTAR